MPTVTANRPECLTESMPEFDQDDWKEWTLDPTLAADIEKRLDALSTLPANWDGYGAPPISAPIISAAKRFINRLPPVTEIRPDVMPMSAGNLQMEWDNGPKSLEIEFESPRVIHFLQWHPQAGVEKEGTFPAADIDRAADLIQWLATGK